MSDNNETNGNPNAHRSELLQPSCSQWWIEFDGKCVACKYAKPTTRKHEMSCTLEKAARNHGLPSRPGGTWSGEPVHKLYGCVYFKSANPQEENNPIVAILDHSYDGAEKGCLCCGEVNEIASRFLANTNLKDER